MTQVDLWTLENELRTPDTEPLCGVDEAGRGPLAGPVCAAAVMLPPGLEIPGLNDSKKLSEKKREALYDTIIAQALSYGIAFATVEEIEAHNILGATFLAMNRAIAQLFPQPALALIDGNRNTGITVPSRCIVGGDGKCADIAAASVLAKVTRDRYMRRMAETYPQYGFEKHKGYGTAAHFFVFARHGILSLQNGADVFLCFRTFCGKLVHHRGDERVVNALLAQLLLYAARTEFFACEKLVCKAAGVVLVI